MRKNTPFRAPARLAGAMTVAMIAVGALQAEQLVTFTRGQSIVVQSTELRAGWYYFTLEGGGEIGVPVIQVASVEEYQAPPAPAGGAAASATPVASANRPSTPGTPLAATPQNPAGGPVAQAAPGQQGDPAQNQNSPKSNVAAPGSDDWRYKVRMSGGPRQGMQNPNGLPGAGGKVPFGVQRPGMPPPRRVPPPQQPPQN